MLPERYRYIIVEGPIGVGKTSLARKLAQLANARLMLESPEDNPFLARFYEDRRRYALPTQLSFLLSRYDQVRELAQGDLFAGTTIADYMLDKDTLFARMNLDEAEFRLYQRLYADLKPHIPTPDLVIYLQAPASVLLERIRRRARGYERGIGEAYLTDLTRQYTEFFYHYDAAPLLIVNSEHINFADNDDDFRLVVNCIQEMRGTREFFNRSQ
ncbi:MAG TPA: deoxynucleoside kinase [Thiobacillaceae bacterium]|nr:deoxynucleoside kinase [Thiobacillaceae bacterium]